MEEEARRKMKTEMDEMRVRTTELQNHAAEKMQEAEQIKKRKFMNQAMMNNIVYAVIFLIFVVGGALGIKFGLF